MKKKLSISQPAVINTELSPLVDKFVLEPNGLTEQWYYENANTFDPDRELTPLIVTPKISALDTSTNTSYTPLFSQVTYYYLQYNNGWGNWQEVGIDSTRPIYKNVSDNKLYIAQNFSDAAHGVTFRCVAKYIDPRNSGRTYQVESELMLTTNRDATVVYPTIDVLAPAQIPFNPLSAESSQITLVGTANWDNVNDGESHTDLEQFVWYAVNENGQEVMVETLPFYVSGQYTNTLVVDAMYSENITIVLRLRPDYHETTLIPNKVFRNIVWQTTPLEAIVTCDNGDVVRQRGLTYNFRTIINSKVGVIDEAKKRENIRQNWKIRNASIAQGATDTETSLGWGTNLCINTTDLINASTNYNGSKLISADIYLLGALKQVTYNGDNVTYSSDSVYSREFETN